MLSLIIFNPNDNLEIGLGQNEPAVKAVIYIQTSKRLK